MIPGAGIDLNSKFSELARFSALIGEDPYVVQGPGGNTSVKEDGILWIKASGTWLADALTHDIFVPIALQPLRQALHRNDPACETCTDYVIEALNRRGLRPSIETTMHAVLPHKVVVHVHCVDTIAWAVQEDAQAKLAPLLSGLNWIFVPYVRPGMPLSRTIVERLQPSTAILILANHGLVVCAESVAGAAALLRDVRSRLRRPAREPPPFNGLRLSSFARETTAFRAADDAEIHAIATDPIRLKMARRGSLYPDHVVFIGPSIAVAENHTFAIVAQNAASPLLVVAGTGVLLATGISKAARAMARCLADVTARLHSSDPIRYLSVDDEARLLNWDAEKHRQAIAGVQR
jgi:rhamnose utilization protein RhaD (predicted bifunctional aldolase and dehydrogenase)